MSTTFHRDRRRVSFACFVLGFAFAVPRLPAQEGGGFPAFVEQPTSSGPIANHHAHPIRAWSTTVSVPGAQAVQVVFGAIELGSDDDALLLTSVLDGDTQIFHRNSLEDWAGHSAWFNGDTVAMRVYAAAGSTVSVAIAGAACEWLVPSTDTLCGNDDRVASNEERVCRIVASANSTCANANFPCAASGFLITNLTAANEPLIVTARHVAVFNVPAQGQVPAAPLFRVAEFAPCTADAQGGIQHAPAARQFPIQHDRALMSAANGVLGDDWAVAPLGRNANNNTVFDVLNNGNVTGFTLLAANAQLPAINTTVRVTGYGVSATLARNRARQTDTGAFVAVNGNVIRHRCDTTNGSSGSPIIVETPNLPSTGQVIGIHTSSGCNNVATTSNAGTSILNQGLRAAIQEFAQPRWQPQNARSRLDIDGQGGSPVDVSKVAGEATVVSFSSTLAGMPWDVGLSTNPAFPLVPSNAGGITLPDGQIIDLQLQDPALIWLNGLAFSTPFVPFTLGFPAPAGISELHAQMVVVNPSASTGIALSAPIVLRVSPNVPIPGPTGDDSGVTISLCGGAAGACTIPFFGTAYTQLHVISNGRVTFGSANLDFSPTVAEALSGDPFVGCWMDLNPAAGGSITITHPQASAFQVSYASVPFYSSPGTASNFSIRISTDGVVSLQNLAGIGTFPNVVAWNQMFLGISRGSTGATDGGPQSFVPNGAFSPSSPTDMHYAYGPAAAPPGGLMTLTFLPLPPEDPGYPNYAWIGQ